jgi:predicted CXXCH cytochrome family protein
MNWNRTAWICIPFWLALPGSPGLEAQESADMCVSCHRALDSEELAGPVSKYESDVHAGVGVRCVDCHGGDASIAGLGSMDPELGFLGRPVGRTVIEVCGRCHSDAAFMRQYNPSLRVDQVTEYWSSRHGQRLAAVGDTAVATCSDCHIPHEMLPAFDPNSSVHPTRVAATCGRCHDDPDRMAVYEIPADPGEKYARSVHYAAMMEGGDLSAPTCNDCHGNHGAAPPGLSWVGNVCGQCHARMADQYAESRHSQIFASLGMPGCATCHGNHEIEPANDSLLGLEEGAICVTCHSENDSGGQAAIAMRSEIDSLASVIADATAVLHEAEQAGMEVSAAQSDLNTAHSALVTGRAVMHSFAPESVSEAVAPGFEVAEASLASGYQALDDLRVRRIGLVASVFVILVLVLGLAFKIRQIEFVSGESSSRV